MSNSKENSSLSPSLNESPGAVPVSDTVNRLRAGCFKVKDTFYFSHDYNARNDQKIKRLIRKHGMSGYGIFWAIVEDLYNNANALHTDYEGIAYDLHTDSDVIFSIINDFDLFIVQGDEFGSQSIERRLSERDEKSEKARQSAFKRWNKGEENANAMQSHNEGNAIKERKGKERIEKDNKENKDKEFLIFWEAYPKKRSKDEALKAWQKKKDKPDLKFILDKIELQKKSHDWQNDGGKYIPYPATYINRGAWHDDVKPKITKPEFTF